MVFGSRLGMSDEPEIKSPAVRDSAGGVKLGLRYFQNGRIN